MSYARPVLKALAETEELAVLLDADLDPVNGGFSWWHGYGLDLDMHTEITGWLVGLVSAVDTNLRVAAAHLTDYRETRHADDRWILERARDGGVPNLHRSDHEARREARMNAHRAGILRAAGSILDTLAGVVVGIGGLDTSLPKADLGKLQPFSSGVDYPGTQVRGNLHLPHDVLRPGDRRGEYLRAVRSSLLHAGPAGWLDWTLWSRHALVHRAARIEMLFLETDITLRRPLPRQPDHSQVHGIRTTSNPTELLLEEDALVTLTGVVESINATVVGVVLACREMWLYRRRHPSALPQPSAQWPIKPLRTTPFAGYNPQPRKAAPNESLAVGTRTGLVLRATKVLDGSHP